MPTADLASDQVLQVQTELTATVKLQLDAALQNTATLQSAAHTLQSTKKAFSRVVAECSRSAGLFDRNWTVIRAVSVAHDNFKRARGVYEQLRDLGERVERAAVLLNECRQGGNPQVLLVVAGMVSELVKFREETLQSLESAPSALLYTVKRYFKRLEDVKDDFEALFWHEPRDLFGMALRGELTRIVFMVKIVSRMPPENRARLTGILEEAVASKFSEIQAAAINPTSVVAEVLERLSAFALPDLTVVRDTIAGCFPPEFKIIDFYLLSYHRNIAVVTGALGDRPDLPPGDTLDLLAWINDYYYELAAQFSVQREDLEPALLQDAREQQLVAAFVRMASEKVSEWIATCLGNEVNLLATRPSEPQMDAEDRYQSPSILDLYQILKQHVETAASASRGTLLLHIIGEASRSIVSCYQSGLLKAIEREWTIVRESGKADGEKKQSKQQQPAAPFFEEYILMEANSALRWLEIYGELEGRLGDEDGDLHIDEEHMPAMQRHFKAISDGFMNISKFCLGILVDLITQSLKPALLALFCGEWYGRPGSTIQTICVTLGDFLGDWARHLEDFLFKKLVVNLIEAMSVAYLEAMRARSAKFRMQRGALDLLSSDIDALHAFFSQHRDPERVTIALEPVRRFAQTVLNTSPRLILVDYLALLKSYPDVPLSAIEEALLRRDDMEKGDVKDIIEACRKKGREEGLQSSAAEGSGESIFSKLARRKQ